MKIIDYEKVKTLGSNDIFLLDGDNGTKTILASDALFAILDAFAPVEMRRNVFRGKNLGSVVTAEQKTNIQNGTFKGFFLGDYWTIGGYNWRIVDFNYWMNCGDINFTTPHLVIMPDSVLYSHVMNETNITTGGYVGSLMYTSGLNQAKTLVASVFGDMVLTHREYLVNAVTDGKPSAGAWFDSSVELPNEIMMYGSYVFTPAVDGQFITNRYTIGNSQLALMQQVPRFIKTRQNYWLRDVVSAAGFASVSDGGYADCRGASASFGVRPVFPIG